MPAILCKRKNGMSYVQSNGKLNDQCNVLRKISGNTSTVY